MSRELTPQEIAERSLIKTYRKQLWNPFIAAVKRYELVSPGDRIAVCISGGKDSMVLAKLMQELQKHTDQPFELTFLVMDPGYNPENRALIEENARTLGIPVVAVGVPTVIAASLLGEGGGEDEPLFLTPRDIDEKVRELGRLIGYGISLGLQEGLSVEDVTGLLG